MVMRLFYRADPTDKPNGCGKLLTGAFGGFYFVPDTPGNCNKISFPAYFSKQLLFFFVP